MSAGESGARIEAFKADGSELCFCTQVFGDSVCDICIDTYDFSVFFVFEGHVGGVGADGEDAVVDEVYLSVFAVGCG